MNQLVAFFAPTTLPTTAGAGVRMPGATQGDEFAAILTQVQATLSGEQPATPDTSQQLAQLLGQLPPGLVQAVKSLSTDDVAAQIEAVQTAISGTPQLDAVLAPLLQVGQTNAPQPVAPTTSPTNTSATPTTIGAVLQALHAQTEATPAAALAPSDVADLGLRGSLTPEQATSEKPAAEKPAQPGQANADVAETLAAQLAPPANLARPRGENQPQQQGQTDKPIATVPKRGAQTQEAPGPLTQQPQDATSPHKQADAPATAPAANNAAQGAAASATPAQPQSPTSGAPNAAPTTAAVPAPVLPTVVDAQHLSVTLSPAPQHAVPLEALAVHIARKFQAGVSQFEIRLHPAELGQLDISLSVADDGHVTAVVRAERPETLDLLQRDARGLEAQLRQAGLDVTSNSLNFSLSNGNGGRQSPFVGWPAFADAQDTQNAARPDAVSTYIAVRRPDGLDIRV